MSLESESWWRHYNRHLRSVEWRQMHGRVLDRAHRRCEGCEAEATQVHHLSYEGYNTYGREFLHELIAVCDDCHERITEMERQFGRHGPRWVSGR
jgi:transcriptional/translational regulatory protein YebC/TACO1